MINVLFLATGLPIGVDLVLNIFVGLDVRDLFLACAETLHVSQVISSFGEFQGHLLDSLISLLQLNLKILNLVLKFIVV